MVRLVKVLRPDKRLLGAIPALLLLPLCVWYISADPSECSGAGDFHLTLPEAFSSPISAHSPPLSSSIPSRSPNSPTPVGYFQSPASDLPLADERECSTVHVAMVAAGGIGSKQLYTTIKSVFTHRSTPLHFHFVTDDRTKTVLQTMLNNWLLPGVSHDYYDLNHALESIEKADSQIQCSQALSVHLNLHLILPGSVHHVVVIEPTSVVTLDLALLRLVTVSRWDHLISVCGAACVSYCQEESGIGLSRWGAVGLYLGGLTPSLGKGLVQSQDCSHSTSHTVDRAVMELVGRNRTQPTRDECEAVRNYDGGSLRHRKMVKCPEGMKPLVKPAPPSKEFCKVFSWERVVQRRELPFLLGHSYTPRDKYDVTMATHLAFNRLPLMEQILRHWDGPASVSIHVTDSEVQEVVDFLHNSTTLRDRVNVTYHLVFKIGPSYPPNHMREIGHRFVSTPYVFFLDVDYVASPGLYQSLRERLKAGKFGNMSKTAVVIPAFETNDKDFEVPSSKSDMLKFFLNDTVRQFHKYYYAGHGPTNYKKWKNATEPYYAKWKTDYEPYYVLETSVVSFDHRFVARFHNKCSHSLELHMAGYRFLVFPSAFVVHLPHARNKQNMNKLQYCSKQWYKDWIMEKRKQYNYTKKDVRNYIIA